jgi:hypothetical protein
VGQASDHGAPDPDSDADHHISGDSQQAVEEHQPPGQAEDQSHQRPDQAGGQGPGLAPAAAARPGTAATRAGPDSATAGSDLDRLGEYRAVSLARSRDGHRQVVL